MVPEVFTYIFPLDCISHFPGIAVLGKVDPLNSPYWVQWVSPAAGLLFLLLSLGVWNVGVRHYCSTGS